MKPEPFVPRTETELIVWLSNYSAKLPVHGAACGLDAAEITAIQHDIATLIWVLQCWLPAVRQEGQSATAFKTQLVSGSGNAVLTLPTLPAFANAPTLCLPGVMPRVLGQVARIKVHPGYSEAIGRDLGIIGTSTAAADLPPDLTARVEQGNGQQRVVLTYTKRGHAGAHIESRRNGGPWEFLGINVVKPHVDERPLLVAGTPEVREFHVRYWDKGEAVGEYSQVAKVTVGT
jgi:hypothetical protein